MLILLYFHWSRYKRHTESFLLSLKKIHKDFIIGQNEKDLKEHQNFKVKSVL